MARDPPPSRSPVDTSPNLRDLSLDPSAILKARPTIIHPQLRDLILPLERGRVLYPKGNGIEELTFGHDDEGDEEDGGKSSIRETTSNTLFRLNFTPNCLVANKNILAAGGQHGELYITNLPHTASSPLSKGTWTERIRPFQISLSLQSRSINNSMILLPSYPHEWAKQSERGRVGYKPRFGRDAVEEKDEDEAMDFDEVQEEMEEEMEDEEEDEEPQSPLTYPNTVPFLHAPRIPHLPSPSPSRDVEMDESRAGPSRRTVSFSERQRELPRVHNRMTRQSFSIPRPGSGLPPIQYVTSRPFLPERGIATRHGEGGIVDVNMDSRVPCRSRHRPSMIGQRPCQSIHDEPRLLISNNDLTIKVFSLKPSEITTSSNQLNAPRAPHRSLPIPMPIPRLRPSQTLSSINHNHTQWQNVPFRTPEQGQGLADESEEEIRWGNMLDQRYGVPSADGENDLIGATTRLARHRSEFERIVGMRVPPFSPRGSRSATSIGTSDTSMGTGSGTMQERKLVRIGGTKFRCAINHSSLSPDLQHMVCVGDSEDVHLFEVIDGGRDFKKVTTYKATDSGFSTAWSRDGRKFAVAAQDGQVTVWDHRSSNPLAKFYSSATGPSHRSRPVQSPSFSSDLLDSMNTNQIHMPLLVDPVTGDPRLGSSTSGREAARVVKFSPEGSPRDLLVFSEENTNIHIIDAQTLNSHITIPVPYHPPTLPGEEEEGGYTYRTGMEGGTWGIAGIAFDPTGQWLYSGTERTVVEWDLRRLGSGVGEGVWDMA